MELKSQLSRVVFEKQKIKNDLYQLKNIYLATAYEMLCKKKSFKDIHQKILEETINFKKMGKATSPRELRTTLSVVKQVQRQTAGMPITPILIYQTMINLNASKRVSTQITKYADKVEAESKDKIIKNTLETNFNESMVESKKADVDLNNIKVFYLASKHHDCAIDHIKSQGRMYIDENWEKLKLNDSIKNAIKYFIKKHNVKSVQWVMGNPVWFITRPNCRHYFKLVSVKEALESSRTSLIEKYNLDTPIGNRQYMQTLKSKNADKKRNAELMIDAYKRRLKLHQALNDRVENDLLKSAITKDKMLIAKWEKYLKELS